MSTINQKLGQKIKEFRKKKNWSQEELAFRSKTDYSYINEIESGKRNPSVKRIELIAKALGLQIRDLF